MAEMFLIVVFGSFAVVLVWRVYDRQQARRLVRLRRLSDEFYPRAHAALAHPDLNEDVRRFVLFMARTVAEPDYAWIWARVFIMRRGEGERPAAEGDDLLVRAGSLGLDCIELSLVAFEFIGELHPVPGLIVKREAASMRRKMARGPMKRQKVADRLVAYERHLEAA